MGILLPALVSNAGFYTNTVALNALMLNITASVQALKNYPNLLMWMVRTPRKRRQRCRCAASTAGPRQPLSV